MTRKFSLAYLTIPGTNPTEQINIAAEAGYDYVSLRPIPMHLPNEPLFQFDKDRNLFNSIKKSLADSGVKLLDIELARVREDLRVEDYESAFCAASELGATDVLSSIWTKNKNYYYKEFSKICELADKYALRINLEFVTYSGVTALDDAIDLLNAVNHPNAYLLMDTLHTHRSKVTIEEISNVDPLKYGIIHLCDGPGSIPALDDPEMIRVAREARLYPGDGEIDLKGMLLALPANPVSIELPNSEEMAKRGALGHAKQCLQKAKQYFIENGIE